MTTAGVVLAAGAGARYGRPKAPVVVDGERLVDRAVRVLTAAGCDPVIVVLGAWTGEVEGAEVVVNELWPTGMASSLRAGLEAVARHPEVERVLVSLVDLPGLTAAAVERVLATAGSLALATYGGRRGHPVLLERRHWAAVAATASGDRGARDYLAARAAEVDRVEVGDVATGEDLDV